MPNLIGEWTTGSILTNPTNGDVLVDTGAIKAGWYLVGVLASASVDVVYDLALSAAGVFANYSDLMAKWRLRQRPRRKPVSGGAQTLDIAGSLTMAGAPRSDVSKQFAGVL